MKWIGISGSWRTISSQLEEDVRAEVRELIKNGDGIVSGGALGVDYIATDEALIHDPQTLKIKIILPTTLDIFEKHFFTRASEGVITKAQASKLIAQLKTVKDRNPEALTEMFYKACNKESYYARNTEVVNASDKLLAFQVNNSKGTQDTIDKAKQAKKHVKHKKYQI